MALRWLKKERELSWAKIKPYVFVYILLPIVVFVAFWLKPLFGIPLAILVVVAGMFAINPKCLKQSRFIQSYFLHDNLVKTPFSTEGKLVEEKSRGITLPTWLLISLFLLALAWCFFGGHGSMWAQSSDWNVRNAIFHDLITYSWPIYYDDGNSALVYYLNYWLPAAGPARLLFIITSNEALCWIIGNGLLLLWGSLGIFLVFLLVPLILRANTTVKVILVAFLVIMFSGMDIVGIVFKALYGNPEAAHSGFTSMHLERWSRLGVYQYSSNTTLLYWVFNQTIIPWICVCAMLLSRNISTLLLILAACFASGPFAGVGLAVLMLFMGIPLLVDMVRQEKLKQFIVSLFSPMNLIGLFITAVYSLYFIGNQSIASTSGRLTMFGLAEGSGVEAVALFILLEVGIYILIILRTYKKNSLYWGVCCMLFIAPLIHIGSVYEFCCRATIAPLFVLMLLCGHFLLKKAPSFKTEPLMKNLPALMLIICLTMGAITPLFEMTRGITLVKTYGIEEALQPIADLANSPIEENKANNFKAPVSDQLFYRIFAAKWNDGV